MTMAETTRVDWLAVRRYFLGRAPTPAGLVSRVKLDSVHASAIWRLWETTIETPGRHHGDALCLIRAYMRARGLLIGEGRL